MKSHIVHILNLQIAASSYQKATELQRHAENWTKNEFAILLNKTLDSISAGEEILFIEKLEIELPNLPWTLTEQEWNTKIKAEISKSKLINLPFEIILQELFFFLKTGSFQHKSIFKNTNALENYLEKKKSQLEKNSTLFKEEIFNSIERTNRFFYHFSPHLVEDAIAEAFSISREESQALYFFITKHLEDNSQESRKIIENTIAILNNSDKKKKVHLFKLLEENPKNFDLESVLGEQVKREGRNKSEDRNSVNETILYDCSSAGLVILLPYIQKLFENLNLLDDKYFKDEAAQEKSLQIFHFLATGKSEPKEENSVLAKLLSGYEISDFMQLKGNISDLEKQECNLLLESVIQHWQALKSTSVDGLRSSFLSRQGRIKIEEQQFELEVENSGIDILLEKVPWGFRNFKLPWMKKAIITQWY